MPGYVIHMAVASRVIEEKGITDSSFTNAFLLGNIIPDAMERTAKKGSHFWDDKTYANLNRIPNVDNFLRKYGHKLCDPYVLGYYSHLLLDNIFVKEYWTEHFRLLDKNMKEENSYYDVKYIKVCEQDKIYERDEFFSDRFYYGDYDRLYPYIFENYPYIRIEGYDNNYIDNNIGNNTIIEEINFVEVAEPLRRMIDKVNGLYDRRGSLIKQGLKIFDVKHIYSLMDRVVSNVCEKI